MSELRLTTLTMPTADLGPTNPLPPLFADLDSHAVADACEADDQMRRNISYGRLPSILPHLMQDQYGRTRQPREHRVAVLENDLMRATFLLDVGGRLWSLVHRPTGRELLFRNPVFQPANLALRNAWVAGGVEWNVGTIGHSTTTCSPLHAVYAQRPDGTPVLRMYEFERLRQVVFQIDACLPDGSDLLLVHIRIVNPNDHEVPIYWWSNIAVPQTPDTRVVAPADAAWRFAYDRAIRRVPIPIHNGLDRTYTTRARAAGDYFFDIPATQRPWIAALDGSGQGLAHTSTQRLCGRKLFLWGQHPGGARWQEWLSGPDAAYLEIQAGLARTQLEHLPLPARTTWSWLEAYGRVTADPGAVHGDDWTRARTAVETALDRLVTRQHLEDDLATAPAWVDEPPTAILHRGTGWGALERHRRALAGDDSLTLPATPFPDDTIGPEQEPWLALLDSGQLPAIPPETPPVSYQTDPSWEPLLTAAGGWLADLHLGVLKAARGDLTAAAEAWSRSARHTPNAWAWRNLAALASHHGELSQAADAYLHAHHLAPGALPLLHELLDVLIRAGRPEYALTLIEAARIDHPADGRLRMLEARAALDAGDLDRCGALLDADIEVPSLREGETSLSTLWHDYQERRSAAAAPNGHPPGSAQAPPMPRTYDFTMHPETT